jgi:hypothetical protein
VAAAWHPSAGADGAEDQRSSCVLTEDKGITALRMRVALADRQRSEDQAWAEPKLASVPAM